MAESAAAGLAGATVGSAAGAPAGLGDGGVAVARAVAGAAIVGLALGVAAGDPRLALASPHATAARRTARDKATIRRIVATSVARL